MVARLRSLVWMVFRRARWEDDLGEELQFHIEARADDLEQRGLTRADALAQARREFGRLDRSKDGCREARGGRWIDELTRNLVVASRSIRKNPGFAAVAVLSLALGIGANLAVFGVLHRLVLAQLPVRDPQQLFEVVVVSVSGTYRGIPYPKFEVIRDNFPVLGPLFGWGGFSDDPLTVGNATLPVRVHAVTGNYFDVLGVRPQLGRLLGPADDQSDEAAVIADEVWRGRFAADPGVVGQTITVGGASFVVVGVAPPGFRGLEPAAPAGLYLSLPAYEHLQPKIRQGSGRQWFHVMTRLNGDPPLAVIRRELTDRWPALDDPNRRRYSRNTNDTLILEDASRGFSRVGLEFSGAVGVLMAVVTAVFLIACANLATLLFVRGAGRRRETSIQFALGASRPQLVRQWMTECLLLSLAGGLAGTIAARWITDLLLLFVAPDDRAWLRFDWSPVVLLLTLGLTLGAGVLCGILPALRATSARPEVMLRAETWATTPRRGFVARGVLAAQLAVSLVLVVASALFARTLVNLNGAASGFDRTSVAYGVPNFVSASVPRERWTDTALQAMARLEASPVIDLVSMGPPPMVWGESGWNWIKSAPGYTIAPDENNTVWVSFVAPRFFDVMGTRVLAGRRFDERDRLPGRDRARVVIVNEKLARHYFGSANPIGQSIVFNWTENGASTPWPVEIVGVVRDTRNKSLRDPLKDLAYFPLAADGWSAVVARSKPGAAAGDVEAAIRAAFAEISPGIAVDAGLIEAAVQRSLGRDRLIARLSALFGILSVLLACMGLYAAVAHSVTSRTREIGIRLAVGASARRVVWIVMQQTLSVTGLGVLIGIPLALAASKLLGSLLFEVSGSDPTLLGLSAATLTLAGIAAGWWPARRAARLDPATTLRFE
jgi:predicted permease